MKQATPTAQPGPSDETPAETPAGPEDTPPGEGPGADPRVRYLRREQRHRVVGGVCGGLGRYCDIDPVIFRVVVGVLALTGGLGLVFYGFAWLLIPAEGEEESEGRRLMGGRVDGTALTAVLLALIGCGLFLTMLTSPGTIGFAVQLAIATVGVAVWSRRRTSSPPDTAPGAPGAAAAAHAVPDAPPETKAPPVPESPSWWRDPIGKEGPPVRPEYLWGPEEARETEPENGPYSGSRTRWAKDLSGPRPIGGVLFGLAALACLLGIKLSWDGNPLGTSLQIGLVAALGVFALGLVISSFLGRTGFGTVLLTIVTALLLAGAAALPKNIGTDWQRTTWRPTTLTALKPSYELGTGVAVLDLSKLPLPAGGTVTTGAEVGLGKVKVIVPANAEVKLRAKAGVGDIGLPQDPKDDIDISPGQERTATLPAPAGMTPGAKASGGTVELRIQVGIGQVEVARAAS
ncbi:PspC domain-containing protein [Streptomyces qinzhouensis]|uniref:PspC domain-containing protein n=1 Tax=Streptomyces qinzhouensis TaxID=2599401 RepID=A0A5B8JLJ8_9ACTN|nr:PspC domain-containing protein [Streptomyces qinzhouensis]QDY78600.1 PspC domain-containing protein [Streptomyces qinzhouensis]